MSFTPEIQDEIRSFTQAGDLRQWLDARVEQYTRASELDILARENDLGLERLPSLSRRHRWELLGEIAQLSRAWDRELVEEVLRVGSSNFGSWLAENPHVQGECLRPLLAWCGRILLTHARIQNRWVGGHFFTTERPEVFRALAALARRQAIPRTHWLLRLARAEARLLPHHYARREVLAVHPEDPAKDGWRALRHAEHANERARILERTARLSAAPHFATVWRQLAELRLDLAAELLPQVSPQQVAALSREDLLRLLTSPEPAIREQGMRALASLTSQSAPPVRRQTGRER